MMRLIFSPPLPTSHGRCVFGTQTESNFSRSSSFIEKELDATCNEVIKLLEETTKVAQEVPSTDTKDDLVFYLKMSGDYYRYLSEFKPENNNKKAEELYEKAIEEAKDLEETHPTRLGL